MSPTFTLFGSEADRLVFLSVVLRSLKDLRLRERQFPVSGMSRALKGFSRHGRVDRRLRARQGMMWSVNAPWPASTACDFGMWQEMQFGLRGHFEAVTTSGL
jgi:hypothetical protein